MFYLAPLFLFYPTILMLKLKIFTRMKKVKIIAPWAFTYAFLRVKINSHLI